MPLWKPTVLGWKVTAHQASCYLKMKIVTSTTTLQTCCWTSLHSTEPAKIIKIYDQFLVELLTRSIPSVIVCWKHKHVTNTYMHTHMHTYTHTHTPSFFAHLNNNCIYNNWLYKGENGYMSSTGSAKISTDQQRLWPWRSRWSSSERRWMSHQMSPHQCFPPPQCHSQCPPHLTNINRGVIHAQYPPPPPPPLRLSVQHQWRCGTLKISPSHPPPPPPPHIHLKSMEAWNIYDLQNFC